MRTSVISMLVVGVLISVAHAEPVVLTGYQLDAVTAGGANFVLTPGQPEGRFLSNGGRAQAGMQVFPELKDVQGFNFVLTPGQPETGKLVLNQGQVQRSTIVD